MIRFYPAGVDPAATAGFVQCFLNTKSFSERIEWRDSTTTEPWQRPLAKIDNLPLNVVLDTNALVPMEDDSDMMFEWNQPW